MAANKIKLEQLIDLLIKEITEFKYQVQGLNDCEENQNNIKNKKLLKQNNEEEITYEEKLQQHKTQIVSARVWSSHTSDGRSVDDD